MVAFIKMAVQGEKCLSDSVDTKEVLVVYKDRRRPIVFKCSNDPLEEYQHILDAVKETFEDVLSVGSSSEEGSSNTGSYYLQKDSKVWGLVDLNSKEKVESHSILHMQLSKKPVRKLHGY